jgi:hypothetical protein
VANGTDEDKEDLHQDCMEVRPYEEDFTTPTKEACSAEVITIEDTDESNSSKCT